MDKVEKKLGKQNHLAQKRRNVHDEFSENGYRVQLDNFGNNKSKSSTRDSKKEIPSRRIGKSIAIFEVASSNVRTTS